MQNLVILLAFTLFTFGTFAYFNQPIEEPLWPSKIPGFAFSPYHNGESPFTENYPSEESIRKDLALIAENSHAIRTYTVSGVFGEIPKLASEYNINIALGAWFGADLSANELELDRLEKIVKEPPYNIVRVIAGNESLLRDELLPSQMIDYLDRLRSNLDLPVSTAEPWHIWIKYPELADHVDYIAVHLLPFWEGIGIDEALKYVDEKMDLLQKTFPNKPIVIGEVGWPSKGRTIKDARATTANEAVFLRRFINKAQESNYNYYVMEAFDQPWKAELEGSVGAYWGVYDLDRNPKFEFHQPIIPVKEWRSLALTSIVLAVILVAFLLLDSKKMRKRGKTFLVSLAFAASSLIIWVIYEHLTSYHDWLSWLVGTFLIIGVAGVWLIVLVEAHEWAEAQWFRKRARPIKQQYNPDYQPFVSIHVPAYNEPAPMLIETLQALARLDYPNFEVLVIDNNTPDEDVWRPVEKFCLDKGEPFKFFHQAPLPGYKAGALNFVLQETNPKAEIIAVIDSDYQVEPNWLKNLVGNFSDENIAIVQAPQDYRDDLDNAFKSMAYAEYKGFFYIGMITRNERNAIIQHGTMTMVRKKVLEEVGGWGEDTITEDAELGLKVFEQGYQAAYGEKSYGKGLIPDTFIDYKKQRYRWAYGAMQILRLHWKEFFFNRTQLKAGQKYHFIAGWLPWIADGFNLIFTLLAIVWSAFILFDPIRFNPPPVLISLVPILFFGFKFLKVLVLYRKRVGATWRASLAAAFSGLSLSHTIAKAVLSGLFIGRKMPFLRTPKHKDSAAITQALKNAAEETFLGATLLVMAGLIVTQASSSPGWVGVVSQETLLWCGVLLVQATPYVAALAVSIISSLPRLKLNLA